MYLAGNRRKTGGRMLGKESWPMTSVATYGRATKARSGTFKRASPSLRDMSTFKRVVPSLRDIGEGQS